MTASASPEPVYAYLPGVPEQGTYRIEVDPEKPRFRWVWKDDMGEGTTETGWWCDSRAEALRAAAVDWDESGSGGRLAATLRAAATRAERAAC